MARDKRTGLRRPIVRIGACGLALIGWAVIMVGTQDAMAEETALPVDSAVELATCQAELESLLPVVAQCISQVHTPDPGLQQMIDRLTAEAEAMRAAVSECETARRLDRDTNGRLNAELLACLNAPPSEDDPRLQEMLADVEALTAEVAQLQDAVVAAEGRAETAARRLADLGFSVEPAFALYGGTMRSSYLDRSELDIRVVPEARLTVTRCPQALDWLASGAAGEWFALAVWVWDGEEPLICTKDLNGTVLSEPDFNDAAHVVEYR